MWATGKKPVAGVAFASYFAARRTAVQSIPEDVDTKVQFNIEDYDNNSEYDNVTNFRWTCKDAGKYQMGAAVDIAALGDGEGVVLLVKLNNTTNVLHDYIKAGGVGLGSVKCFGDLDFSVDDYVEVIINHNAGGNKNTGTNAGCRFWAHRFA